MGLEDLHLGCALGVERLDLHLTGCDCPTEPVDLVLEKRAAVPDDRGVE